MNLYQEADDQIHMGSCDHLPLHEQFRRARTLGQRLQDGMPSGASQDVLLDAAPEFVVVTEPWK